VVTADKADFLVLVPPEKKSRNSKPLQEKFEIPRKMD